MVGVAIAFVAVMTVVGAAAGIGVYYLWELRKERKAHVFGDGGGI